MKSLLLLILVVAFSASACRRERPAQVVTAEPLDQELAWFPPDTETVVAVTQPGKLNSNPPTRNASLAELCPGLASVGMPAILAGLQGPGLPSNPSLSYRFILDGSRRYLGPAQLGIGLYEGCKIVCLEPSELSRAELLAKKNAKGQKRVAGLDTYILKEGDNGATWTFYLCFDGNLMFCATDMGFLKEVLDRRARNAPRSALPDSLEEWQYVQREAPFWAVRRFQPNDPWAKTLYDNDLTGYTVCLDKEKKRLTVASLSANPKAFEITTGFWLDFLKREGNITPLETKKEGDDATIIVLDAAAPNGQVPVFVLVAVLGHPVAL